VPAYTLAEKRAALHALAAGERAAIIDTLARDAQRLLDGERLDSRYGRAPEALESVLATIAPYLDEAQASALLARYGLPMRSGTH
jgi:hypothetical protein